MENLNKARDARDRLIPLDLSEETLAEDFENTKADVDYYRLDNWRRGGAYWEREDWEDELRPALGVAGFTAEETDAVVRAEGDGWREEGFHFGYLVNRYVRLEGTLRALGSISVPHFAIDARHGLTSSMGAALEAMARRGLGSYAASELEFEAVGNFLEGHLNDILDGQFVHRIGSWPDGYYLLSAEYGAKLSDCMKKFQQMAWNARRED